MLKRSLLFALFIFSSTVGYTADTVKVVATQAIFSDLVRQVGQDRVDVKYVASPKFNIHFIQPKPSDVRNVARADLYVNGGLDLEAWSDPLLEAAGKPSLFRGAERNVDLSKGVELLKIPEATPSRAEGDIHLYGNPHFHMDPENARIMARSIADKLKEIDAENAEFYEKNISSFLAHLDVKTREWKELCAACAGKEIISYHDDIVYFARFLGLKVHAFLEPKPGIPPTAKHLAQLESEGKAHGIRAVVMPTYYSKDAAEHVAERIGAQVVLICQNAGELPGTEDFFSFFDTNVKKMAEAMQ